MKAHAICPVCGQHIQLVERKDWESFSMVEYVAHVEAVHPEEVDEIGVPYAKVVLEPASGARSS